jgi:hypothetical protein
MEAETASIAATSGGPTSSVLDELASYTACDVSTLSCNNPTSTDNAQISDALLKLEVPGAGFLPDICMPKLPHIHRLHCRT